MRRDISGILRVLPIYAIASYVVAEDSNGSITNLKLATARENKMCEAFEESKSGLLCCDAASEKKFREKAKNGDATTCKCYCGFDLVNAPGNVKVKRSGYDAGKDEFKIGMVEVNSKKLFFKEVKSGTLPKKYVFEHLEKRPAPINPLKEDGEAKVEERHKVEYTEEELKEAVLVPYCEVITQLTALKGDSATKPDMQEFRDTLEACTGELEQSAKNLEKADEKHGEAQKQVALTVGNTLVPIVNELAKDQSDLVFDTAKNLHDHELHKVDEVQELIDNAYKEVKEERDVSA